MTTTTSSTTDFVEATRHSTSILMAAERRCLLWLAARLPRSINADHLTSLALAAMAAAGACFWAARFNRLWLAGVVVSLAVNWFGDSLDGTVARVRQQQRPRYGFYVDHIVDCFGVLFLFGGLAMSGFMNPLVAMALLIAYFMLSIETYLATYACGVFKLSFAGMGPTELRVLLAVGSLALMGEPQVNLPGGPFKLFDVGAVVAIAGMGHVADFRRQEYSALSIWRNAIPRLETAPELVSTGRALARLPPRWRNGTCTAAGSGLGARGGLGVELSAGDRDRRGSDHPPQLLLALGVDLVGTGDPRCTDRRTPGPLQPDHRSRLDRGKRRGDGCTRPISPGFTISPRTSWRLPRVPARTFC